MIYNIQKYIRIWKKVGQHVVFTGHYVTSSNNKGQIITAAAGVCNSKSKYINQNNSISLQNLNISIKIIQLLCNWWIFLKIFWDFQPLGQVTYKLFCVFQFWSDTLLFIMPCFWCICFASLLFLYLKRGFRCFLKYKSSRCHKNVSLEKLCNASPQYCKINFTQFNHPVLKRVRLLCQEIWQKSWHWSKELFFNSDREVF